jgi:CRISPR system Cascade subunit CasE
MSTLEFNGVLRVVNVEQFLETLHRGIGPAKAFGCGLLPVRRV